MALLYWEWHLIPRWLLRRVFALFPEQLLKCLVSWGNPGKYSMIDCSLGDASWILFCTFWTTALRCAADTHLKLLDRVVSGASFLTGGVFECDLAHCWSVVVLCILYKITCNPLHPLYDALAVTSVYAGAGYTPAHRYTYVPPRCRTSQFRRSFIPLSVSLRDDLSDPVFDGVGLAGFKSMANFILFTKLLAHFFSPAGFPFSAFILWVVIVGGGHRTDRVLIALSQPCITNLS